MRNDAAYPTQSENGWTKYEQLVKEIYLMQLRAGSIGIPGYSTSDEAITARASEGLRRAKLEAEVFFQNINK